MGDMIGLIVIFAILAIGVIVMLVCIALETDKIHKEEEESKYTKRK